MNVRNPHPSGGAGAPPMTMSGLRRSFSLLKNYRGVAFLAYFSLFISTAAMLMVPQITQNIIDAVTHGLVAQKIADLPAAFQSMALQQLGWTAEQFARYRDSGVNAVLWFGALIVLFAIARGLFAFSQGYNAERVSQGIAFDLRNRLFEKIQRLSFSYHDRNQTGQLMVRATDDVDKVRLFLGQGLLIALQSVVLLVAALVILSATNYRLMLTILPILPVAMAVFFVFSRIAQPLFLGVQQRLSRLNTILQENLAGIKVIKAFVQEPVQKKRFTQAAEDLMSQQIKVSRTFIFLVPFVFLIANLGQALIQYAGGRQIIEGTLSIGEWQKFSMYLFYVFFPLGQLGFVINQLAQASASANRIYEILDAESEVKNKPDALDLPPIQGRVEFRNVTFKYFGSSEPALDDVSFVAEPGQTIALLGATGSGKSTIINLIPRFYDVSAGSVLIDGYDVRDVTIESLRRQIGIVLQDTTLFTGTIRENIAFGKPEATQEEIEAAAKAALAHDIIMSFPDGYETRVGERGTTLSGGQKQRIAIARALLLDPRILILDDSTSSVDTVTEYQIQQALNRLMKGRTSFVIAQRIGTVRNADQILVLDRGRIVARGRHEDLLEESPIYAEIYHSQLIEDAPAVAALHGASAAG